MMASTAVLAGSLLADSDTDKGSPIGLFIVLILIVAVYFLYRSLSGHIRGLPESFDEPTADAAPAPGMGVTGGTDLTPPSSKTAG